MDNTYATPTLTNYGSITKLTQAGTSFDGGGGGILNPVNVAVGVADFIDVTVGDEGGTGWLLNLEIDILPGPDGP